MAWIPSIYELAPDNSLPEMARLVEGYMPTSADPILNGNTWVPAPLLGSVTPATSGLVGGPIDSG